MAGNNQGPWGGGNRGGSGGGGNRGNGNGNGMSGGGNGRRPGGSGDQPFPELDEMVRKGQERLKVLMGGRGGGSGQGGGSGSGGGGPQLNRRNVGIGVAVVFVLWLFASVYTVRPDEQSVELFLGEYSQTGQPGLNFAPWPLVTHEVVGVTRERSEQIGTNNSDNAGLMLTTDANIVDIGFQVVWNIADPAQFLFNLRDPDATVRAVAESAMREVIAQSELAPILNRARGEIEAEAERVLQETLRTYNSGINIIRVNLDRADPPPEVIDAFREVQAAEQQRDRLQRQADAYANRVLAGARGEAAEILEQAEAYRARIVNTAEGEASRFTSVRQEFENAPEVTRKRIYLETMEQVLGNVNKVILDSGIGGGNGGGNGVVPYLPLNELQRNQQGGGQTNGSAAPGSPRPTPPGATGGTGTTGSQASNVSIRN